ncbi:MAG: hypothetical protein K2G41_02035 [Duncaniella sp.]|uniref:hypothetical protein n=1 Tax=Duncaniella sp. TaxID=2518496 RepID=UPI0023CA9E57|nr:hypothetical protein [Duncaniella sp.]MDE6089457.1 hypothetical protein [Duncaniella sp.]
MKKIFTLFAAAATAISVSAEVKTVDVSITWPMAKAVETTDPDTGEPKTSYSNDLTPVITAGYAEYMTVGEPVLGSEIAWGNPRNTNGMIEALVQPTEQVKAATEGHSLSFVVTPNAGYTFKATKLTLKANVIGTGGGNYDLTYTVGGNPNTLAENFHPNRNNEDNDYYSTLSYDLTGAASESALDVTFMIYNLANNKQMGFSDVVITGELTGDFPTTEPTEPSEPSTDALMSWDFTKWSEATVANLKAGSNWSDIEKADDTEPTEATKDNCFWQVSYAEGKNAEGYLTANDVVIEELKGLVYTNEKTNRSLAIAVNYPETSLGTYHGPAYLWLGSKEINYFVIPGVPAGATIKMGVESHKNTDARGVELSVNGETLKAPNGSAVELPTTYAEQEWLVPATAAATNDVQIYNTNGCHIYFITVTGDSSTSAISNVAVDENAPVEYYNLQGVRVENPANGLYIKRQGSSVSKVIIR